MSNDLGDRRTLLQRADSAVSEISTAMPSPKPSNSPRPASASRRSYHQPSPSQDSQDAQIFNDLIDRCFEPDRTAQGLGISGDRRTSIPRVPVGSRAASMYSMHSRKTSNPFSTGQNSPQIADSPLFTEPSRPLLPSPGRAYNEEAYRKLEAVEEQEPYLAKGKSKSSSFTEDFDTGDIERGMGNGNYNDNKFQGCPPAENFHNSRTSWLSISVLMLSVYSTIFSGIWLVLACVQPRYGRLIRSGGSLAPGTASIVFALFAKTIELSFVTVFVTFLGQVLSRRSIIKASRGINIPEMTMRTWVIQPGFMITHFEHLKHVGLTFLGAITLFAAFIAMFYTTASDAIVSPQLKFGGWENRVMQGRVQSSYADLPFIKAQCETPITLEMDPVYAADSCSAIDYAGQAYHNSITYLSIWNEIRATGEASTELWNRPRAQGMLYDNTTVTGSWIMLDDSNITAAHQQHKRVINNVSLAMPHAGVYAAARDSKNGILQPEELLGVGEYEVRASVVSPVVNVLCVNMNHDELAPLIYNTWPNALTNISTIPNQTFAWPGYEGENKPVPGKTYLNSTVVDDLFQWGEKYKRQPPIFPMYPINYNTLTNTTVPYDSITYPNTDSIYLLAKSPNTTDYTMCQMRSYLTPVCSSHYNVSGTEGGHLESHCEDPYDNMKYSESIPDAQNVPSTDWRNVATGWSTATSMNDGLTNNNASISRLLSQLIVPTPVSGDVTLNTTLPSLSEMLAVMVGSTLLSSTTLASFHPDWNSTIAKIPEPVYQSFNASLTSQQYTSGYIQKWQGIFYIVLLLVFCTNVWCLVYFIIRSGLVTDYTEPQNLFALAVNSPASRALSGSCGAGPHGPQLNVNWHVMEESSGHMFFKDGSPPDKLEQEYEMSRRNTTATKSSTSYSKLSGRKSSWL